MNVNKLLRLFVKFAGEEVNKQGRELFVNALNFFIDDTKSYKSDVTSILLYGGFDSYVWNQKLQEKDWKVPASLYIRKGVLAYFKRAYDDGPNYIAEWLISIASKIFIERLGSKDITLPFARNTEDDNYNANIKILKNTFIEAINIFIDQRNEIREIFENIIDDKKKDFVISAGNSSDYSMIEYSRIPGSFRSGDRVKTTFGRYLRRNIKISKDLIPDSLLNIITTFYATHVSNELNFDKEVTELEGKDISEFYDQADVKIHSCMTGKHSNLVELYQLNPDKVKLVTFKDVTRALLWTCDDGALVLDRIYPAGTQYVSLMAKWAEQNGIITREDLSGFVDGETPLSDNSTRHITVKHNGTFPYLDTFKFGENISGRINEEGVICLCNMSDDAEFQFTSTSGEYDSVEGYTRCFNCSDRISEDSGNEVEYDGNVYCRECFYQFGFICEGCGEPYSDEEINEAFGDSYCDECFVENFVRCVNCDKTVKRKNSFTTETGDNYCNDCLDEIFQCIECEKYYGKNDKYNKVDFKPEHPEILIPESEEYFDLGLCKDCARDTRKSRLLGSNLKYNYCDNCNVYVDYDLINNKCMSCGSELFTGQYLLPFEPEIKDTNLKIKETLDNKS